MLRGGLNSTRDSNSYLPIHRHTSSIGQDRGPVHLHYISGNCHRHHVSSAIRLPEPKLQRVQLLLQEWLDKRSCTWRELERLLGHLSHAATIIHPGRIFLRQLFNLLSQAHRPYHHVCLNRQARADLKCWQHFLQAWNGIAFYPVTEALVHIYSDASRSFGCGMFNPHSEWLQLQWPASWNTTEISAKELVPVVVAAAS